MKNVLITGSTGGIGEHLCSALRESPGYRVFPLSRHESEDSPVYPCDLRVDRPRLKDPSISIDWIIHLATTYKTQDDLAMLRNLLDCAREHHVENFIYASSWVIHFPPRPIKQEYVTMKRACERELDQAGDWLNVYIVRPSVVIGDQLVWDHVLRRLSSFYPLIPGNFSRSFVQVDEVSRTTLGILGGQIKGKRLTLLGQRRPLRDMARQYGSQGKVAAAWLVGGVLLAALLIYGSLGLHSSLVETVLLGLLAVWALGTAVLKYVVPEIHEYFAGFKYDRFYPETEEEVTALCHSRNHNIVIKGYDNKAKYYHERLPSPHTHIVLEKFNQIRYLDLDNNIVRVEAGICFADLLNYLKKHDRWLDNYPNYHYITAGACILCPVHGSSIQYPFLADLVDSFRYYDRRTDEVIELSRQDERFAAVIFNVALLNQIVVLTVDFRVSKRVLYQMETLQTDMNQLNFVTLFEPLRRDKDAHDKHVEVRVNSLRRDRAYIQTYVAADYMRGLSAPTGLQAIKADSIGKKWNLIRRNVITKVMAQVISRPYVNFEWFFEPAAFTRFWEEIASQRRIYRFYKLLLRFNASSAPTSNPYYNTISIDVMVVNTSEMLRRCRTLYECYRPLEHSGKFTIGDLTPSRLGAE